MKPSKILKKALASPNNIRFGDMIRLLEAFGFEYKRTSGSHHIYNHAVLQTSLNLQNLKGKAKPYQVEQFLSLIESYQLQLEDESDD